MRTPVFLLIVPAAVGAFATLGSQGTVSESGVWTDEDRGTLRIEGICDIKADRIGCWDMEGRAKADLSDEVRKTFQRDKSPFRFAFGKKNRYVVFDWKPKGAGEQKHPQDDRIWLFEEGMNFPGRSRAMMHVATSPSSKDLEFTIKFPISRPEGTFKLKLQPGEIATVGDKSVEVKSVDKVEPEALYSPLMRSRGLKQGWRVRVESKNTALNYLQVNLPQQTADGKRFHFVDENGEPSQGLSVAQAGGFSKMPIVAFVIDPKNSNEYFETNLNPLKIAALEFTPSRTSMAEIKFGSVPADPKPGATR